MATFEELRAEGARALAGAGIETSHLDARILLCHASGLPHESLVAKSTDQAPENVEQVFRKLMKRRAAGAPVARIVGTREFWGMEFKLSAETLVPRPDSEPVVEALLGAVADRAAPLRVLDLGTGSGCLLIALLSELPNASGVGVDLSQGALGTARDNAAALGFAARASFVQSNWGAALDERFDIVVSNPPYIPSNEVLTLDREVKDHDPHSALDGGADGLDCYSDLLQAIPMLVKIGGIVAFETSPDLYADLFELVSRDGEYCDIRQIVDLARRPRGLTFRKA